MPLITKNLIVGTQKPIAVTAPTVNKQITNEDLGPRFKFGNFINKSLPEPEPVVEKKVVKTVAPIQETRDNPKYIKRQDGELVRHINTKSQYLKDIFEDF